MYKTKWVHFSYRYVSEKWKLIIFQRIFRKITSLLFPNFCSQIYVILEPIFCPLLISYSRSELQKLCLLHYSSLGQFCFSVNVIFMKKKIKRWIHVHEYMT